MLFGDRSFQKLTAVAWDVLMDDHTAVHRALLVDVLAVIPYHTSKDY
jgi:hypothetical protein